MEKKNELKAGVLLSYVNLAIGMIIPIIYTPVMLRLLGQAEYGLYSLSNSVISYLSLLTFGLGGSILRYLTKARTLEGKDSLEHTAGLFIAVYAVIAVISFAVGVCLTLFTGTFFAKGLTAWETQRLNVLIMIMSLSAAVSLLCVPYSSLIICYERFIFRRIIEIIGTIAGPIFSLVVLYAGFASVGMAIVSVVFQIVFLGLYMFYCASRLKIHPKFRNLPLSMLKSVFSFTVFVFLSSIADLMYWSTDKILLGAMVSSSAVAVYNVGATFNSILQKLSTLSGVFSPRVNQYVFLGREIDDFSELMIRVGRIQYLILSLVLSGFIAFGQVFIVMWAGEGYEEAYMVALLTMIPLVIPLIQSIAFATITAQNRHKFRSVVYVALAFLNVIGTYLLIPHMGMIGAALCTCIVFILGHGLIMNWFYYKKIGLDIPKFWKNIAKMTIVPLAMIIGSFLLNRYVTQVQSLLHLLCEVCIYTIIFCVLSWLISMNEYEKNLVISFFHKVRRKKG